MKLDDVLHSILQGPNVKAIVLFDELYIPLAARGAIDKTDIQFIVSRISQTIIGTVGQITLNDRRLAQFHHAETHIVVLIKGPASSPPGHHENFIGSPSSISTTTQAKERRRHSHHLSSGSRPIFAPGTSAGLSISTISASLETIKGWTERKSDNAGPG